MIEYVSQIDGSHDMATRIRRTTILFTKWCNSQSLYWFKKIKLHHWSENAKLLIFSLFALGIPAILVAYYFLTVLIWLIL